MRPSSRPGVLSTTPLAIFLVVSCCWGYTRSAAMEEDPEVTRLRVKPEDQEVCEKDMDCDDWCKERSEGDKCVCRCGGWIPTADLTCPASDRYCQVPPRQFWGGSKNMTEKAFKSTCKKKQQILVVFSAKSCRHCIDFEPSYRWAGDALHAMGVPLARVDVDQEKEMATDFDVSNLPVIHSFHKCKNKGMYKGVHSPQALETFGKKLVSEAVPELHSDQQVLSFSTEHSVAVLGFFGADAEEEEEDEFREAGEEFRFVHNVYLAVVKSPALIKRFAKTEKWFKQTPSVVVFRNFDADDADRDVVLVTELADQRLQDWIAKRTVRMVDEITGNNFIYYESLRLPMLLLFVDKEVDNKAVLKNFKAVARDYQGQVSFAFIDGKVHAARKIALGLTDDNLPAMAFNTMAGVLYPFASHRALSEENIRAHVQDFLAGRGQTSSKSMSDAEAREAEAQAEKEGAPGLVEVTLNSFHSVCMDPTHDVMVLFYNSAAQVSKDFWPYFKKTVERFKALEISTIQVARYDLSRNQLPNNVELESLPSLLMFPAKDKSPPFRQFHGKAKVRPIMLWAQQEASIKFEYPNDTPHLDEEQRKAYLVQIKERDERVAEKRAKEKAERIEKLKQEGVEIASEEREEGRESGEEARGHEEL